jgi:hypothetical protein
MTSAELLMPFGFLLYSRIHKVYFSTVRLWRTPEISSGKNRILHSTTAASTDLNCWFWGFTKMCLLTRLSLPLMQFVFLGAEVYSFHVYSLKVFVILLRLVAVWLPSLFQSPETSLPLANRFNLIQPTYR